MASLHGVPEEFVEAEVPGLTYHVTFASTKSPAVYAFFSSGIFLSRIQKTTLCALQENFAGILWTATVRCKIPT